MTVQALQGLIQKHSPEGLFLCETKVAKNRLERVKNTLGYENLDFVEADLWKCGIAFLWKENLDWEVIYKFNWIMGIQITKTREVCGLFGLLLPRGKNKKE